MPGMMHTYKAGTYLDAMRIVAHGGHAQRAIWAPFSSIALYNGAVHIHVERQPDRRDNSTSHYITHQQDLVATDWREAIPMTNEALAMWQQQQDNDRLMAKLNKQTSPTE